MGVARLRVNRFALLNPGQPLELSQAAYDEIEAKLLDAGYHWLFDHGPGTGIDLSDFVITREAK